MRARQDKALAAAAVVMVASAGCAPSDHDVFAVPRRIGDRCTLGATLSSAGGYMTMACKGPAAADNVWALSYDGRAWTSQQPVHIAMTRKRPAVALFRGGAYVAWRADDSTLWYSVYIPQRDVWSPPRPIAGESAASPAFAVYEDRLFLAWRGSEEDTGLWWAKFDGETWSEAQPIPGATSSIGPALGASNLTLMLVFKREQGDKRLLWTTFDGTEWAPPGFVEGARTNDSPVLAGSEDEIFLAWRGAPSLPVSTVFGAVPAVTSDEDVIWWSRWDAEGFGQPRLFRQGFTRTTPGLAVYGDKLCFAWADANEVEKIELVCLPLR